jgi:hypothetical protein
MYVWLRTRQPEPFNEENESRHQCSGFVNIDSDPDPRIRNQNYKSGLRRLIYYRSNVSGTVVDIHHISTPYILRLTKPWVKQWAGPVNLRKIFLLSFEKLVCSRKNIIVFGPPSFLHRNTSLKHGWYRQPFFSWSFQIRFPKNEEEIVWVAGGETPAGGGGVTGQGRG